MASLHPLVPSPRLLRFLRLQSESLGFFGWSHDATTNLGQAARRVLCAARRQQKNSPRLDHTMDFSQNATLQAGMLDLDSLIRSRGTQPSQSIRQRNLPYFLPNIGLRYNSSNRPPTKCQTTWRDKLWGFGARKKAKPLEPDDLPNDSERGPDHNSMFNTRRQLSQKAALEPRLRCTEVDENGNVILVDGEFKKSELIARVCLP